MHNNKKFRIVKNPMIPKTKRPEQDFVLGKSPIPIPHILSNPLPVKSQLEHHQKMPNVSNLLKGTSKNYPV